MSLKKRLRRLLEHADAPPLVTAPVDAGESAAVRDQRVRVATMCLNIGLSADPALRLPAGATDQETLAALDALADLVARVHAVDVAAGGLTALSTHMDGTRVAFRSRGWGRADVELYESALRFDGRAPATATAATAPGDAPDLVDARADVADIAEVPELDEPVAPGTRRRRDAVTTRAEAGLDTDTDSGVDLVADAPDDADDLDDDRADLADLAELEEPDEPGSSAARKRRNAVTGRPGAADGSSVAADPSADTPDLDEDARSDVADIGELEEPLSSPAELETLMASLTDEERALFDGSTPEDVQRALDQALLELAEERTADQS